MKSLSKISFASYLLILLWLVLFKFSLDLSWVSDHQVRNFNLIPFADFSQNSLREIVYNFVAFIPFGLLLRVNFKRNRFWQKLIFIFIFSLVVEIAQLIFAIGAADITDVIANTSGGFLGLLLYSLSNKYVASEKLDRLIVMTSVVLLTLFFLLRFLLFSIRYQSAY